MIAEPEKRIVVHPLRGGHHGGPVYGFTYQKRGPDGAWRTVEHRRARDSAGAWLREDAIAAARRYGELVGAPIVQRAKAP